MANVKVELFDARINELRFSPAGPVGRDLTKRLRTLELRGRTSAGVDTGALRANISRSELKKIRTGLEGRVGSSKKYAAAHHEGARPHVIVPRKAKALKFKVAGKVVFARRVNHPGNRPNPYLARWLREAVR